MTKVDIIDVFLLFFIIIIIYRANKYIKYFEQLVLNVQRKLFLECIYYRIRVPTPWEDQEKESIHNNIAA